MFVEVLRLRQEERRELLQEKYSVVSASSFRSPSEIAVLQQEKFHTWGISIFSFYFWVIILKQLFASGSWILVNISLDLVSENIHQYSLRLWRIIVNCPRRVLAQRPKPEEASLRHHRIRYYSQCFRLIFWLFCNWLKIIFGGDFYEENTQWSKF